MSAALNARFVEEIYALHRQYALRLAVQVEPHAGIALLNQPTTDPVTALLRLAFIGASVEVALERGLTPSAREAHDVADVAWNMRLRA